MDSYMKKFKYTAVNLEKKKFTGVFIAENEKDLARQLAKQNLFLISAKPASDNPAMTLLNYGNKIKMSELTQFCRQFAIMCNSGMSIVEALSVLKGQDYDKFFKLILDHVYEDVKAGLMLSAALDKHKGQFPNFFKSMIYVGEQSGKLEVVMNSLADYYEQDAAIRRKTKGAFAYPLMLMGMTVAIVVVMMLFVIPKFKDALSEMNVEMPALTQAIYDMSDYVIANWWKMLIGVFLVILVIKLIGYTKSGRMFYDKMFVKAPLIKKLNVARITARFARGFSLLLSSGMDIVEAMEEISVILGNVYITSKFKQATEDVRQGMSLTMAFETYDLFPDILTQMISVGEKTASIEEVLNRSCGFFDEQAQAAIEAFTSAIQPVMLCIMGGIIGTLFIAIYSPMLSIMGTVGK